MTSKAAYRIASIPGDGIGTEVVAAAIQVVEKLARTLDTFQIEFTHIPWGTAYYKQNGRYVPEDCLDILRKFDAGLFGAVGAPGMYDMREVAFRNAITISNTAGRCAGSYLPLGSPPSHPWPIAALRQCPPGADLPRNEMPLEHRHGRYRLAACPRKLRGRVLGTGRQVAYRAALGGRHRGGHVHAGWDRADHALCI